MISLEEYRVAIGTSITKLFCNAVLDMCCDSNSWALEKNRVNYVTVAGAVLLTLQFAIIVSLLQHEDIESNPGL